MGTVSQAGGTIPADHPMPLLQDLGVIIQSSTLISSPKDTERRSMFLSNIDQVLNFDVQTIHFFPPNPNYPPEVATEKIRAALEKLCVTYDFLAGRVKLNTQNGRFEFDCNNAGLGFVVATSKCALDEIGDLVYPNPAFEKLITKDMGSTAMEDHPLCIFQVTSFKCGGFAMGVQTNHATFDGTSFKNFLHNIAAVAADKPLEVTPFMDRTVLSARSPPQVKFPHHELLKLNTASGVPVKEVPADEHPKDDNNKDHQNDHIPNPTEEQDKPKPTVFDDTVGELDFKVFRLSDANIIDLKIKAKEGPTNGKTKITGFNVVTAHVWRCKALSFDCENNPERQSTILFAIDIRTRLDPPIPSSFTGNAVLTTYATAKCKEIEETPISRLVEMLAEGSARMNDDYARSAIDWGELYKGFPNGEFLISSWWRLGFSDVEYPWGKPKYCCPLVYKRKDIILLFPDIDDDVSSGGVNVLVALPHKEMTKFENNFYKYLQSSSI